MTALGVGGSTEFKQSAEMPVGIAGVSGLLTIHVVDAEIPLLLPISMLDALGMVLNLPDSSIYWTLLEKESRIQRIGTSKHVAVEVFDFPESGWVNPYEHPNRTFGDDIEHVTPVPRSEFECPRTGSSKVLKTSALVTPTFSSSDSHADMANEA